MDFNAIIKRVIAIITKPNDEWEVIKNETMTTADMYVKYAIIVAAIPAIAGFIGWALIGRSFGFRTIRVPVANSLVWAILTYVLSLVSVFIVALIIDALAPSFGSQKDMNRSLKVAVFSATAGWVGGIFNLIPSLAIIGMICAIYGLYLLYIGLKRLKESPQDKLMGYFVVTLVVTIIVYFVIGLIVGAVVFGSARGLFSF
jgi:hypothetical protein